jgi:DNA invertase Pin-like site-specific DNA recombinase
MQPTRQSGDQHYSKRTPHKVKRGVDAPGAKLSEFEIAEIRAAFDSGATKTDLARAYGVSRITIWRHLKART